MLPSLYRSLLAVLCASHLACSQIVDGLAKRQQCGPSSANYLNCGCCFAVPPAACYAPATVFSTTTIIGRYACYPTPPGIVIGTNTEAQPTRTTIPPPTTSPNAPSPTSQAAPPSGQAGRCAEGTRPCHSGCIPIGDDCCPGQGFCTDNSFCKLSTTFGRYGCCPRGTDCDTENCSADEQICGDRCISNTLDCCNQGNQYCFAGTQCYQDSLLGTRCCTPGINCPGNSLDSSPQRTATGGAGSLPTVTAVSRSTIVSVPTGAGFQSGGDARFGMSSLDMIMGLIAPILL